ncbi:hypothetical protein [Nocardia cyriacigeorgica]|uniref:hypothetical protein n=1 Tax=Nocardia cyriacigeorgica TaxID=135487 RepID=UPI002114EABC|nr:hypothetical protein [Nocardia cyriacigeorgica]
MLHVRIMTPADKTDQVVAILEAEDAVSGLAVMRGAAIRPDGDLVLAHVAREAANELVDALPGDGRTQVRQYRTGAGANLVVAGRIRSRGPHAW